MYFYFQNTEDSIGLTYGNMDKNGRHFEIQDGDRENDQNRLRPFFFQLLIPPSIILAY